MILVRERFLWPLCAERDRGLQRVGDLGPASPSQARADRALVSPCGERLAELDLRQARHIFVARPIMRGRENSPGCGIDLARAYVPMPIECRCLSARLLVFDDDAAVDVESKFCR
jgi:hypothetical protein